VSAGSVDQSSTDDGLPPGVDIRASGINAADVHAADGRIARWRARADAAADQYQKRAQDQPLLGLPLALVARYTSRQGMLLASASAFRLFLWLLPLALMSAGILAVVAKSETNAASLESASKRAGITGAASQQVVSALHDGHRSWWIALLVGAVFFLWATRTLLRNLMVVNAHAWGAAVPKMRQKHVLISTVVFAGAWIAVLGVAALVTQLDNIIPGGRLVTFLLEAAATAGVWLIICARLPDRRRDWVDLLPGCIAFGVGLSLLRVVSRVYLPARFEKSSQLYGSLGVAAVMLAWLLIIGQLIVVSALINVVWSDYRADRRQSDNEVQAH
jgi:uncharacterized BrkB/YihY/UPF0761 family membrane protein